MGLKMTNENEFNKYLDNIKNKLFPEYIIKTLSNEGEIFIRNARLNTERTFTNRTTRLRNSIGYIIAYNGNIEKIDFESYAVSGTADEEGKTLGRQYATDIAKTIKGYALVCVAGADYAYYVEVKGYNVITREVLTLKQRLNKWSI